MKKYEFVPILINRFGFGSGNLDHRDIIRDRAAKGYKYAGYVPTDINGEGKIREIDLIFEKDDD